jgi:hypothetical protein
VKLSVTEQDCGDALASGLPLAALGQPNAAECQSFILIVISNPPLTELALNMNIRLLSWAP